MLTLFQSPNPYALLPQFAQRLARAGGGVFADHRLIVPSMTMSDWLVNQIAIANGICAQLKPVFWGEFAWKITEEITGDAELGGYAPLSAAAMQWQLFAAFCAQDPAAKPAENDPVAQLLATIPTTGSDTLHKYRLAAEQLAGIFIRYLSLRPQWLWQWSIGQGDNITDLLDDLRTWNDLPAWFAAHLTLVMQAQRQLWQQHFARAFLRRSLRLEMFWRLLEKHYPCPRQAFFSPRLDDNDLARVCAEPALAAYWQRLQRHSAHRPCRLPDYIFVYDIEGVTKDQWHFLADLGRFATIDVFHHTPCAAYIADLVDEKWLQRQELTGKSPLRDSGHPLFSRFGKQQRSTARLLEETETFARAHGLEFLALEMECPAPPEPPATTTLQCLRQELCDLNPTILAAVRPADTSIQIHACHGLMRQLEILRGEIAHALNRDPSLQLSDILIVLPDPVPYQALIRAIFPPTGAYDGYHLPARITGITPPAARHLWEALSGVYRLATGQFDSETVCDWLLSDDVCAMLGVNHAAMVRVTTALIAAGFRRGFAAEMNANPDGDGRFTFCYALDRLCAGLLSPDLPCYAQQIVPADGIDLNDAPALNALCYLANRWRHLIGGEERRPVRAWLEMLREQLRRDFVPVAHTLAYSTVLRALGELDGQLAALARDSATQPPDVPLRFVLDDMTQRLAAQQSSSEPSGVITIGRLGAMRGLPYKMVAFVNFNLDEFPSLRPDDRYDLIYLDREQAGDRQREHEELGALLQTLTLATQQVLFFYDRVRADGEEQLPASALQELGQYLRQQNPVWAAQNITHQPDPFHPDQSRVHPAPLWHKVATALHRPPRPPVPFIIPFAPASLPPLAKSDKPLLLPVAQLVNGLQRPERRFARAQNLAEHSTNPAPDPFEPLFLDPLQNYQLENYLCTQQDDPRVTLLPLTPAGVAGKICLQNSRHNVAARRAELLARAPAATRLSPLREETITIAGITISAALPVDPQQPWLRLSASKAREKHLVEQWLLHLLRHAAGGRGETLCAYRDRLCTLRALPNSDTARNLLHSWLQVWQYSGQHLWLLPPEVGIAGARNEAQLPNIIAKWCDNLHAPRGENQDFGQYDLWRFFLRHQRHTPAVMTQLATTYLATLYQPLLALLSEEAW